MYTSYFLNGLDDKIKEFQWFYFDAFIIISFGGIVEHRYVTESKTWEIVFL